MKLPFSKKEKQVKPKKTKKIKVRTVGKRKKSVLFLWILLLSSLAFGIYKNFTAIDLHTVHEREIIESHIQDTTAIESFTRNFVTDYYSWENNTKALEERTEKLKDYLTEELQALNSDMIREDIPTSSTVQDINIWSISEEKETTFSVVYSVQQKITEEKDSSLTSSTYRVVLHQDEQENLVIIQNPTLWNAPEKSSFTPEQVDSDGTVESETVEEVTVFLETFFASYPTATEQELAYYVKNNALPVIDQDYTFSELINPVFQELDNQIKAWITVIYLDEMTKATQLSQYELTLEKDSNWVIVEQK
ncbi:conjugal transfer protein [Lentibacillus populi]|uniref:Conjugal transfer protein n=1 Tax=Lentibacillus populi TaxID=1827502 RepID=A0A9W5X635_9BACI|nr:conjugal transfer protein [Lentibacillus populi]GGB47957.1 conjugal transfer protein [Lentibacillus populi]